MWACDCCRKGYAWKHNLVEVTDRAPLITIIGGVQFGVCSFDCARNVYLVRGMESVFQRYTGGQAMKCKVDSCQATFEERGDLLKHQVKDHGYKPAIEELGEETPKEEKKGKKKK